MGSDWLGALLCYVRRHSRVLAAGSAAVGLVVIMCAASHTAKSSKIGPNTIVSPFDVSGAPPPCVLPESVIVMRTSSNAGGQDKPSRHLRGDSEVAAAPHRMGAGPGGDREAARTAQFAPFGSHSSRSHN